MNKLLTFSKQAILIAVPISLVVSIYVNSLVTILFLLVFLPDLIKNFKKNNFSKNRKVFFVFSAFVLVYLIGIAIDIIYGTANFRKSERLLPFILFPLFLLFSDALAVFEDKKTPLKIFGAFVLCFNLFLLVNLFTQTVVEYNDNSLSNKRWKKSNIKILENSKERYLLFPVSEIRIADVASRPDLFMERSFNFSKDTLITRSIYVKSNDDLWLLLRQFDGTLHEGAWFHPKTARVGFVQKNITADIQKLDNGWCRISVTNRVAKKANRERLQITFVDENKQYDVKGNAEYKVHVGGAQLEIGDSPSDYMPLQHRNFLEGFDRTTILNVVEGHPTYYSLFILISVLVIVLFFRSGYIQFLGLALNLVMLVLLGSKAAILTFFILLFLVLYFNFKNRDSRLKLLYVVIPLSIIAILSFSNTLNRFNQSLSSVTEMNDVVYLSTDKRIEMWKSVIDLPLLNLVLGNGNTHGYELLESSTMLTLNSHNQYLEAVLCSGFIGLILLLFFVVGIFFVDFSARNNQLLVLFVVLVGFNLFFENILNRQWGIVFVAFFLSYIYKLEEVNE